MPGSAPTRQYCSQGCLLGLKKGRDLDNGCPNVLSHRMASEASTRHLINAEEFTRLVSEQLCKDPYRNCYALDGRGKKGAIGVLFRLELEPYGYTFVGKGTWSNRLERLRHECCVYERLESLQGWVVPVQLGLVHLGRGYVLPGGTRAVHMMLMSWGGEEAAKADMDAADLREQWHRSSAAHGDERHANLLWNTERRRIMIINFNRAVLRPPLKHCQLSAVSGIKRQYRVDNLKILSQKRRKRSLPLNGSQFAYLMSR
ncbi:unnamed protein product [Clonostachys chloroleuca]|uniref:Uncharacterized protein n=1 Tax=Clonostachys chloroleuca TaxID=1926264 RepID=A0AA35M6F6_9HYPO|nr:unnamed protein product [Clonostachys chloroleuca]